MTNLQASNYAQEEAQRSSGGSEGRSNVIDIRSQAQGASPVANANYEASRSAQDIKYLSSVSVGTQGVKMADHTREEIDAKLAAVEARTETHFVELSGKIDRIADSINNLTSAVTTIKSEVKEEGKFTRWTICVTIIASMIAFASALWVTQGNLLSAFQAGLLLKSEQAFPPPSLPRPPSTRQ